MHARTHFGQAPCQLGLCSTLSPPAPPPCSSLPPPPPSPMTLIAMLIPDRIVAKPRSPILTVPEEPLTKMLSHCARQGFCNNSNCVCVCVCVREREGERVLSCGRGCFRVGGTAWWEEGE
jgi:hypothetical protein